MFVTLGGWRRIRRQLGLRMDRAARRHGRAVHELAVRAANVRYGGLVLAAEEARGQQHEREPNGQQSLAAASAGTGPSRSHRPEKDHDRVVNATLLRMGV